MGLGSCLGKNHGHLGRMEGRAARHPCFLIRRPVPRDQLPLAVNVSTRPLTTTEYRSPGTKSAPRGISVLTAG